MSKHGEQEILPGPCEYKMNVATSVWAMPPPTTSLERHEGKCHQSEETECNGAQHQQAAAKDRWLSDCEVDTLSVMSFPADSRAAARQRLNVACAMQKSPGQCIHEFVQHFGGSFSCAVCWAPLETAAPDRVDGEQQMLQAAQAEDAMIGNHADYAVGLGVTVRWLIAFTLVHDCWEWTTAQVQLHIIKPMTQATRQRYAELPEVRAAGAVGHADVFISRECAFCALFRNSSESMLLRSLHRVSLEKCYAFVASL